MAKSLKKRANRGQKSLQLYVYGCSCTGCGSVPTNDIERVYSRRES